MRPNLPLVIAILATIGSLWAADIFLARTERIEMHNEAQRDARTAERLLARSQADGAVSLLGKAHALDRNNDQYALQLAEALMAAGKLDEAQSMLSDVLARSPNNGQANLIEARSTARQDKFDEAVAYYHRALYGIWPADSVEHRIQVRLELANLLASHGSGQDLLAELLLLETDAQNNIAVRRRVARLYLVASSPGHAVSAYRALIRDDPKDGDDYAGLGEAELALGNYRAAQAAFQNAIVHGAEARARLDLASQLADLDPTPRRLSSSEKFARSVQILQLARDALAACAPLDQAAKPVADADTLLKQKIRGNITNEMAEERLSMAQDLWDLRTTACHPSAAGNQELLALMMKKLAQ